jgi:hypothetical protein
MQPTTGICELIDHARSRVQSKLSESEWSAIRAYSDAFDAAYSEHPPADLHIFVFHLEVPSSHRYIKYVDCEHDHWSFDYRKLTSHFLWAGFTFNPSVRVFFVTNGRSAEPESHPNLTVVRLPTDDKALMLERVKAMTAYVHSRAFVRNSVFLDTDAYPNRPLHSIFNDTFDIGVTFRTTPGYMPLNEGAIFASCNNTAAVRRFFSAYIATYQELRRDSKIADYYGDIDRWRGGQLSLNALACPQRDIARTDKLQFQDITVGLLPCNRFNYWVTRDPRPGARHWDRKFILHLKGDSKVLLESVADYQRRRATTLRTSSTVSMNS